MEYERVGVGHAAEQRIKVRVKDSGLQQVYQLPKSVWPRGILSSGGRMQGPVS
jgi:hypothetical protein